MFTLVIESSNQLYHITFAYLSLRSVAATMIDAVLSTIKTFYDM